VDRPIAAASASLAAIALTCWTLGCASTQLVDVWQDESHTARPLTKVLVVAISEDERNRRIFEDSFARAFRAAGVEAISGYSLLPSDAAPEAETISKAIEGKGIDGVVISHHAGSDEETVYYPGRTRTEAWGTGGYGRRHYDGYYRRTYETVHEPGRTAKYTTVFIETNIFETTAKKLIWSARSASDNPESALEIINALSKEVIESLRKGGLI
jgi:hypothetical protein